MIFFYFSVTADGPADRHPAAAPPGAAAASPQPAETRPAVRPALQPRGSSRYHFSLHSRPQRIPLPDGAHFQIVIVQPRLLWSSLAWRFITKSLQFYRKTASFHSLQELGGGFVVVFTCLGVDKKNMEVRRSLGAGGEVGVVARTSG